MEKIIEEIMEEKYCRTCASKRIPDIIEPCRSCVAKSNWKFNRRGQGKATILPLSIADSAATLVSKANDFYVTARLRRS